LCSVSVGTCTGFSRDVAVKTIASGLSYKPIDFRKEVTILSMIKHPNACPFYGAHESENEDSPSFIVMPYFANGSLVTYITKQAEIVRKKSLDSRPVKRSVIDMCTLINMATNMANAIHYLHSKQIIHRDIKPANFLIDDDHVIKVCDFGVSRALQDVGDMRMTFSGTYLFMAPEVYEMQPYNTKADVYSFGLVLWCMVTGETTPYKNYLGVNLIPMLINEQYREPIPEYTQPELAALITKCWHPLASQRPTFDGILDALYSMQSPYGQKLHYNHMYDKLTEDQFYAFVNPILQYLDPISLKAFSATNKKFNDAVRRFKSNSTGNRSSNFDRHDTHRRNQRQKNKKRAKKVSNL